jgi:hypothetical protein
MRYELNDHEWFAIKPLLPKISLEAYREWMTAVFSMASSGSYARAHRGATCPEAWGRILPPIIVPASSPCCCCCACSNASRSPMCRSWASASRLRRCSARSRPWLPQVVDLDRHPCARTRGSSEQQASDFTEKTRLICFGRHAAKQRQLRAA